MVGELNQIDGQWSASIAEGRTELAQVLAVAYDETSARVRALGYEIGPDGAGALCLWNADNTGPLTPAPASDFPAAVAEAQSVALFGPRLIWRFGGTARALQGLIAERRAGKVA